MICLYSTSMYSNKRTHYLMKLKYAVLWPPALDNNLLTTMDMLFNQLWLDGYLVFLRCLYQCLYGFTPLNHRLHFFTITRTSIKCMLWWIYFLLIETLAQNQKIHIHLYFIATKYLRNNAFVEHVDNWTRYYIRVIMYQKRQNNS